MSTASGLLADIASVGADRVRGGFSRHGYDHAELELREWFVTEARARGLDVEADRNGNLWAWWGAPGEGAVVTGSHLDSVPGGGAFDGPLGVVSGLAAVDALQAKGFRPTTPFALVVFAEEEGGRFGVPCLGSRLLAGTIDPDDARRLTDQDGTTLADAVTAAGLDAGRLGRDEQALGRIGRFVELHVEQGRGLVDLAAPVGVASSILAHGRWRFRFTGEGNHAGATLITDRRDPMLPAANLVLAARRAAEVAGARATVGRIVPVPGGTNVIASAVDVWLDARADDDRTTRAMVDEITGAAREAAAEQGCELAVTEESYGDTVVFEAALRDRLAGALGGVPALATGAGHDAGRARRAGADRDAVRPQPDRREPRTGRTRRGRRLHRRGRGARHRARRPRVVTAYWCARAWLPDGIRENVLVDVAADGTIAALSTVDVAPPGAHRLDGLVLPGFANAHSHAFHRALRGRTHDGGGTFWTWRTRMYALAAVLDPDSYLRLARGVYGEMALAGITCVGEFHYLHHPPGGGTYADPNAMGEALRQAAADAGIRITLLDTCYLAGGIGEPVSAEQARFSDLTAERWAQRVELLRDDDTLRVGSAIHSVRAVPRADLPTVALASAGRPLHVHLSEQPAENAAALVAYGLSPTELLAEAGALGERTTAVHATHLSTVDIELLGAARAGACFCPSTEADLADGIGPARELFDAGCVLSLGSDQHAVVDPIAEARALEHGERLRTGDRGRFAQDELFTAATSAGHAALGWPEAGRIAPGAPADLVAIALDTPRTAGCLPEQVLMAASAADVRTVVSGGRVIVADGVHTGLGDVGRLLAAAIAELVSAPGRVPSRR